MLVRVGGSNDVAAGAMPVFDVAGTKVNVASVSGRLYAFDDACTHQGCSLANGDLDETTLTCAYCAVQPPSTGRIAPVTRPAARDDRKTTAAATSAVVPTRPMGIRARTWARNAGSSRRSAVPGV